MKFAVSALQVFDTSASLGGNKVKASQCFTKYKWRSKEAAGSGPVVVATQVCACSVLP